MKPSNKHIVLFLLSIFLSIAARATHLRSVDIQVTPTSNPLRFQVKVLIYTNTGTSSQAGTGNAVLYFGDGRYIELRNAGVLPLPFTLRPDLGENIGIATFETTITYQSHGTYRISYREGDRSAGIINMFDAGNVKYFTYVTLNTNYPNTLPRLTIPPVDKACRFNSFTHNPGAFDADGDKLKYRLVTPRALGDGIPDENDFAIPSYLSPVDPSFYGNFNTGNETANGPPTFSIDEDNGTITWDAPDGVGEYNIAFVVEEYREDPVTEQMVLISTTVRDMQIVVEDCGNVRPTQTIPSSICVTAGALLKRTIKGYDHENGVVKMEAVSDVFNFPSDKSPATYEPFPPDFRLADPYDSINFTWQTDCDHVRARPYQVVFRISDKPPHDVSLVTVNTWNITVMAPAPAWKNPTLNLSERHARLSWQSYACQNADKIQIWRRVDHYPYVQGNCETGIPKTLGFSLIAEVDPSDTVFVDTNNGRRLVDGAQYCYRIVAIFRQTNIAYSKTSPEFCFDPIQTDAPVITHVTLEKTSKEEGAVRVSWRSPFAINKTQFPEPYQYHIYRADGFAGDENLSLVQIVPNEENLSDTTFLDTNLNTLDNVFNYRIVVYAIPENETAFSKVDTSGVASTERLSLTPGNKTITLAWRDSVPWSNVALQNPWHVIYRGTNGEMDGELQKYDSIKAGVDSLYYIDDHLDPEVLYYYRVKTRGTYGNPLITLQENFSQTAFSYPINDLKPCKPILKSVAPNCDEFLAQNNCDQKEFDNTIHWHADKSPGCRKDIVRYKIYYASTIEEEFKFLTTTTDTLFKDEKIPSFARCYRVTAIDQSGNESEPSEMVCNDNCLHFELPNVFTPNGDGYNDLYSAYYDNIPNQPDITEQDPTRCPRFVSAVDFYVYNRWGEELYHYQSGPEKPIYINWNGEGKNKNKLETGIYYYAVWVTFNTVDPSRRNQKYKGWIHLIR